MPSKVLVSGVLLVVMVCILVFIVEFFLPLSVKADMNMLCRNTLLKMESDGGLSENERLELQTELEKRGFESVAITGTPYARQGERLNLRVEGAYRYSKLSSLFLRSDTLQVMGYDKASMSRRVVN